MSLDPLLNPPVVPAKSLDAVEAAARPYWIAFSHVPGIGPARLGVLMDRFGSIEKAWRAPDAALVPLLDQRSLASLIATRREIDPDALMRSVESQGIDVVLRGDAAYPDRLRQQSAAPYLLYVRGDPRWIGTPMVAVVGTRRATAYGRQAATRIAADLAAAGVTVVSGLAVGIDAAAHAAALEAGGGTVAVLGCGVDVVYPPGNRTLGERIAAEGALVSEYPPGRPPDPGNFPARNRIVAGLSMATVVVEAGEQSGALITAGQAAEQGGEVFAVPGSIFSPVSAGANRLLADGAGVARSADDVLSALSLYHAAAQREARALLPASPQEAAILAQLAGEPLHVDEIGRALAVESASISSALTIMELKGLVRPVGGQRWMAAG